MKPEQAIFPILFFVICFLAAALVIPVFLRRFNIRLSSEATIFVWGTGGTTLIVLIAFVLVTVYHVGLWGYISVGALLVLLSLCAAVMYYNKRRRL